MILSSVCTETFRALYYSPIAVTNDIYRKIDGAPGSVVTLVSLDCFATESGGSCAPWGGTVRLSALTTLVSDTNSTDALVDVGDWVRFDVTSVVTAPTDVEGSLEVRP